MRKHEKRHTVSWPFAVAVMSITFAVGESSAWTIDTGCIAAPPTGTGYANCLLTNFHPTKTATVNNPTTTLVRCDGAQPVAVVQAGIPGSVGPVEGHILLDSTQALATFDGVTDSSASINGVRCHFDITGIPKGKIRGTLITSSGTLEAR